MNKNTNTNKINFLTQENRFLYMFCLFCFGAKHTFKSLNIGQI